MSYSVLFSASGSGGLESDDVYANAREMVGCFTSTSSSGQATDGLGNYFVFQLHLCFDTSILGAGAVINSIDFWVNVNATNGGGGGVWELRQSPWTGAAPVAASDKLAGSAMSALPTLGYFNETQLVLVGAQNPVRFTNEALFAAINKTGKTLLCLHERGQRTNTPPGASSQAVPIVSGTDGALAPRMLIDWTPAPTGSGGTVTEFRRAQDHL